MLYKKCPRKDKFKYFDPVLFLHRRDKLSKYTSYVSTVH